MEYSKLLEVARELASAGRCPRRGIGCVIAGADGSILGAGSNGPPQSLGPCACPGRDVPAGAGTAVCYGVHAEVRALVAAAAAFDRLHTVVSTKAPCTNCVLNLLETPVQVIIFETGSNETTNRDLWLAAGRNWVQA